MTTTTAGKDPIVAPEEDRSTIASIEECLESKRGRAARLVGPSKDGVPIPSSLRRVLVVAARQLADGNGVSIMPVTAEVTTQQAADLLNVSRPFVIGLLDKGENWGSTKGDASGFEHLIPSMPEMGDDAHLLAAALFAEADATAHEVGVAPWRWLEGLP